MGGEHSEDLLKDPFWNAGNGLFTDPGRSDVVYSKFIRSIMKLTLRQKSAGS